MLGGYRTFDVVRDGEATDLVFPHFVGESLNLYHHPDHKWYFAREQQRNEVWVFKCFDSKPGVAMGVYNNVRSTWCLKLTLYFCSCPALIV